jgi:hypothetical protein
MDQKREFTYGNRELIGGFFYQGVYSFACIGQACRWAKILSVLAFFVGAKQNLITFNFYIIFLNILYH